MQLCSGKGDPMPRFLTELLPPNINCPHCHASMALDEEERTFKRFKCPACKKKIDLRVQVSGEPVIGSHIQFPKFHEPGAGLDSASRVAQNLPGPDQKGTAHPPLRIHPRKIFKR